MWVDQRVQTISWGLSLSRPWPSSAFLHVSFLLYKSPSKWKALWSAGYKLCGNMKTSFLLFPSKSQKPQWLRGAHSGPCVPILANSSPRARDYHWLVFSDSVTSRQGAKPLDTLGSASQSTFQERQQESKNKIKTNKQTHKSLADKQVSGFVLLKKRVTSTDTLNFVSFFEESGVMGSYVEKACRWTCGPGSGRNIIKVSTTELLTNIAEASREGRNNIP